MTFDRINRRAHLYLALFLLPWFFMWGVTSVAFNHAPMFQAHYDDGVPIFATVDEMTFEGARQPNETDREFGQRVFEQADLQGANFGYWRPNDKTLNFIRFDFWNARQVVFHEEDQRMEIQVRRDRWDHILTGMHARAGFDQEAFLPDAWAVMVDFAMIATLLWICTGLYMWWHIKPHRNWGLAALTAGFASFAYFIYAM
jgi:hypothetical protein